MSKKVDYSYLTASERFNSGKKTEFDFELEAYRKKRNRPPKTTKRLGYFKRIESTPDE